MRRKNMCPHEARLFDIGAREQGAGTIENGLGWIRIVIVPHQSAQIKHRAVESL
jgi:hypothetical protein